MRKSEYYGWLCIVNGGTSHVSYSVGVDGDFLACPFSIHGSDSFNSCIKMNIKNIANMHLLNPYIIVYHTGPRICHPFFSVFQNTYIKIIKIMSKKIDYWSLQIKEGLLSTIFVIM